MYASYVEDTEFRSESWDENFEGVRVVLHDTTNVSMKAPSNGDMQKALHSQYYKETCAKGGVAAQPCNWMFGLPLVTGHSTDDQQIDQTKILKLQKAFQDKDLVEGIVKEFLNIFDKGYHQLLQAKENGQRTLVPDSGVLVAECHENLFRAASVAVTRSGNERAVRRAKISDFVKKGGKEGWTIERPPL